MLQPRVVVLDDDVMIRRFVAMALEDMPIELVECGTVAAAMLAVSAATGPVPLVITDLMLKGESGFDLLASLQRLPASLPPPLVAVFSAGVMADVRKKLSEHAVWRVLPKPVGVAELEGCVTEALLAWQANGHPDRAPGPEGKAVTAPASTRNPGSPLTALEQQALHLHFAGDLALFTGYRAACMAQWAADIAEGDAAVAATDAPALRRLGHSLKTVLGLLGRPDLAQQAQALDDASVRADWPAALPLWQALRQSLHEAATARQS